jgi:DNA helicase-2/ATP-dependent DNA helicase PcrA
MPKLMQKEKEELFKIRQLPEDVDRRFQEELNDEQYEAVTHEAGPALVIAGPGSGKTRVLTYRAAWLLEKGASPEAIALMTFTKKAAQDMIRRVEYLTGGKGNRIIAGTFHHICNRFLKRNADALDWGYTSDFTILDREDAEDLMKLVVGRRIPEEQQGHHPRPSQLVNIYSKALNLAEKIKDVVNEFYPGYEEQVGFIIRMIDAYQVRKREMNVMDFDDLLVNFLNLLRTDDIGNQIKSQFEHVLVDEYQDVNTLQADIVKELSSEAQSVMVVGDDAQAIYSFRGAQIEHMLEFPERYDGTTEYRLESNYRSVPEILDFVNASIAHNESQFEKTLQPTRESGDKPYLTPCLDVREEANLTCSRILELNEQGVPLSEQAVLFRARHHSLEAERACINYGIQYEMRAGLRFFERAHIKDAMAHLILLVNPADVVQWMRVLTMQRGIGDVTASKVLDEVLEADKPMSRFVRLNMSAAMSGKRVYKTGMESLQRIQKFFRDDLPHSSDEGLPSLDVILERIIEFIEPIVQDNYDNADERIQDLRELVNFSARYEDPTEFLSDVLTMYNLVGATRDEAAEEDSEKVVLSTIHQAKGLEWDAVYIIRLLEGALPFHRAFNKPEEIEEERRLFYVASTRAKDYLFLTYPDVLDSRWSDEIGTPSRFIEEIRDEGVFQELGVLE